MVIEVPCRADAGGAVPLPVSAPSAHQLGLMAAVRASERDIADAALTARWATAPTSARAGALALRAFASHPLVGSLDAARSLAAAAFPAAAQTGRY
jgi:6-phospho-beta-glucosidase